MQRVSTRDAVGTSYRGITYRPYVIWFHGTRGISNSSYAQTKSTTIPAPMGITATNA